MGTTPGKPPVLLDPRDSSPLLERDAELEVVDRQLENAVQARGALLLLEGPAGIGKTRLLGETRLRAEQAGFQVLHARGGEFERGFAHGVVRQLFEPVLTSCSGEERARLMAGAARLATPLFEYPEGREERARPDDAAAATLHGLYWLTANVAERAPALVAVDDLHWSDLPSLRFISYLARRLDGLPVVVAASVRTGEPVADDAVLAELEADPLATILRPAPLTFDSVTELLRASLGTEPAPEFLRAIDTACRGNPLLLVELVHAVVADGIEPTRNGAARVRELGPETLTRHVLQRLRRLGRPAEDLARAVAILGDEPELALAAALAGLDDEDAAASAAALARAQILRSPGSIGFVHPVLRAAVYADLTDPERALAHDRAAELLAQTGATPQQVAAHLVQVPPRGRATAVATLREAAQRATAEGAAEAAVAYLRRALAEPPDERGRADVLLELGVAEIRSGLPDATEHLREACELLPGGPRLVEGTLALASMLFTKDQVYEAVEVLERSIQSLEPEGGASALRLEAELIMWARLDARLSQMARERLARIRERAGTDSFGGRLLLVLTASELARASQSPAEARALVEQALGDGVLLADESSHAYATAVAVLLTLDELEAAVRRYTDWLELARSRGSAFAFASASRFRAQARLRRGDLAEAEADLRAALDATLPLAGDGGYAVGYLAETLAERGQLDEALSLLHDADVADEAPPTYQTALRLEIRARLRVAAGDADQGLADLLAAGARLEALGVYNPSHAAWRSNAALLLAAKGELDEARRLASREVELARSWGAPRPFGVALRASGLIEEGAASLDLLRQSVDVLGPSAAVLERGKSLTELGAALRRTGRRAEARGFLEEALDVAQRCGAAPLADRAHAELLATGARPRRLVRTGVESLTASERRVARMAADGKTNREIAQALFVTPKTIEMHLSNAYRKLDVQARSQLPGVLHGV